MAERNPPTPEQGKSLELKKAAYDALKAGDLEQARELFGQLSKTYPWVASFKFNLALTCFKLDQMQEALKHVNAGLAIDPDDEKARSMKSTIIARQHKAGLDAELVDGEEEREPFDPNREELHATAIFQEGLFEYPHITRLLGSTVPANTPDYSDSRLMNFVVFEKQRRRLEVFSTYQNNVDDHPHASRLAWYFTHKGMDVDFKPIPNDVVFHPSLTLTSKSLDELTVRIAQLPMPDEAVFLDTVKARFSYDIGIIKEIIHKLHKSNQYQQVIQACDQFLKHFPDDLEILFELGSIYVEMGNLLQGEATYKKIIENYYENAYAWFNLARIYEIKGLWQYEAFCLGQARNFGYVVDEIRLARLTMRGVPVDPFTDNVKWE